MAAWIALTGTVVEGHGVASGRSAETPYPGGSIPLQIPHFAARGVDLSPFYPGTLNVSIAPLTFSMTAPRVTLRQVNWIDLVPPEDFSFAACRVTFDGARTDGLVYYPHPETKVQHFHDPSLVEVLAPLIPGIFTGARVKLEVDSAEITVHDPRDLSA